jgi:hypothetical protein
MNIFILHYRIFYAASLGNMNPIRSDVFSAEDQLRSNVWCGLLSLFEPNLSFVMGQDPETSAKELGYVSKSF